MKISVVIPTYNCARFLPIAIDSVLAQTYPPDEILVIDDGSTDDTEQLVTARYAKSVRFISQKNAGPSAARNHGIRSAGGDVIGFLDADDAWLPDALLRVSQTMEAHPEVALVTADKQAIDSEGSITMESWWARHGLKDTLYGYGGHPIEGAFKLLLDNNFVNTSLAFVRKKTLDTTGLFDEGIRFGEDWDLWLRIAAQHAVAAIPEVLGQYRLHDANVTRATETMLKDLVRVNEKLAQWAAPVLHDAHVSSRRRVAEALSDLGYWYFTMDRYADARRTLARSLASRPTTRAWRYTLYCCLPDTLLTYFRNMREHRSGPARTALSNISARSQK